MACSNLVGGSVSSTVSRRGVAKELLSLCQRGSFTVFDLRLQVTVGFTGGQPYCVSHWYSCTKGTFWCKTPKASLSSPLTLRLHSIYNALMCLSDWRALLMGMSIMGGNPWRCEKWFRTVLIVTPTKSLVTDPKKRQRVKVRGVLCVR